MSEATVTTITPAATGDPKIEAWLDEHHVTWKFEPALALERIDMKRSLANQARVDEPLIADTVDMYTLAYKDGAQFPPIICRQTSTRARVVNLDGNHRASSAIAAKRKTHPAYVVECTDEAAMMIMYEDNMANGAQLSKKQRLAIAVHLIATGMTQAAAAKEMGVQDMEVSTHRKLIETTRRAVTMKVRGFDDLPAGQRLDLGRINSDPVFAEAAKLLVTTKLQGTEASTVIKRIKAQRSDSDALVIIGQEYEDRRDAIQRGYGGKTKIKKTAYGTMRNALSDLLSVRVDDVIGSAPASIDRAGMRKKCRDAALVLKTISEQL